MQWANIDEQTWRVQSDVYFYTVKRTSDTAWEIWHTRYALPQPFAVRLGIDRRPQMEFILFLKIHEYTSDSSDVDTAYVESRITEYETGNAELPAQNQSSDPMYFI